MTAEQILQRWRPAAVMHGGHRDPGRAGKHHADEMRRPAGRRGCVRSLAGVRFAPLRELGQGLHALRYRRTDIVGQHRLRRRRHRDEVPQRVVAQRAETVRVDRHRKVRREQHHASVGLRVLYVLDRDARGGARLVFNQHRGRVRTAQPVREDACNDVGAAACRKADDDVGRFLGRQRERARDEARAGRKQPRGRGGEQVTTREHCGLPSLQRAIYVPRSLRRPPFAVERRRRLRHRSTVIRAPEAWSAADQPTPTIPRVRLGAPSL